MDQKSIHKQLKMDPKSIKHRSKSRSGGILEASWRHLGVSWGVLEAFWGVLGGLETSWGRLENILIRLGGVLGPLGASCGRFGSVLEVSRVWFSGQRGLNLGMLSWMSFCNWFLVDFASKNRCPNYEKSSTSKKKRNFLLSDCFNIISLLDVFDVNLGPV